MRNGQETSKLLVYPLVRILLFDWSAGKSACGTKGKGKATNLSRQDSRAEVLQTQPELFAVVFTGDGDFDRHGSVG